MEANEAARETFESEIENLFELEAGEENEMNEIIGHEIDEKDTEVKEIEDTEIEDKGELYQTYSVTPQNGVLAKKACYVLLMETPTQEQIKLLADMEIRRRCQRLIRCAVSPDKTYKQTGDDRARKLTLIEKQRIRVDMETILPSVRTRTGKEESFEAFLVRVQTEPDEERRKEMVIEYQAELMRKMATLNAASGI